MKKTNAVAYYSYKIKSTNRIELIKQLQEAPIKKNDYNFIIDIIDGLSYKELSEKYHKSESRIYQWKRTLLEELSRYDLSQTKRKPL